jgi:hypothetical protein
VRRRPRHYVGGGRFVRGERLTIVGKGHHLCRMLSICALGTFARSAVTCGRCLEMLKFEERPKEQA